MANGPMMSNHGGVLKETARLFYKIFDAPHPPPPPPPLLFNVFNQLNPLCSDYVIIGAYPTRAIVAPNEIQLVVASSG